MDEYHTDDLIFLSEQPREETQQPREETQQPLDEAGLPPMRFIDIHVYDLPTDEAEAEPLSVESDPLQEQQAESNTSDLKEAINAKDEHASPISPPHLRKLPISLLTGFLAVLLIGALGMVFVLPLFTPPTATITIVPIAKQVRTTTQLTITTRPVSKETATIAGPVLPAVTMSQQQTVPTTGIVHQPAQAAHGTITFYNAATYAQTISAGTMLTGADGVQIVTEQSVKVPAVAYPTLGQASVAAQAARTGPAGNIKAGDIYGPCCVMNISAVNGFFTGGAKAREYRTVTQHTIDMLAANITASLVQSEQAALQTQVHADETLINPPQCEQIVTPNHRPGQEATQVHVMVSETCTGMVYDIQQYQKTITQMLNQEAYKQLGTSYQLTGAMQDTITQVRPNRQQAAEIQVSVAGTYAYHFTQEQQQAMTTLVAGKSKAQATNRILQVPGVQSVSISIEQKRATLPTDTRNIHLLFLSVG